MSGGAMNVSRDVFYDLVGQSVFGGSLSAVAIDNIEIILDYWSAKHANRPLDQLAYILATVRREVGSNMAPVRETFAKSDEEARAKLAGRPYAQAAGEHDRLLRTRLRAAGSEHERQQIGIPIVENRFYQRRACDQHPVEAAGRRFNGRAMGSATTSQSRQGFFRRRTVNMLDHAEEMRQCLQGFLGRNPVRARRSARQAILLRHMRFDDRLALRRQLVQLLGQAFNDAAAARLDAGAEFLEIGLARRTFGSRLGQCDTGTQCCCKGNNDK